MVFKPFQLVFWLLNLNSNIEIHKLKNAIEQKGE